jgi:hypothetical protein
VTAQQLDISMHICLPTNARCADMGVSNLQVRAEWACRNKGTASTCEALMMLAKELKVIFT